MCKKIIFTTSLLLLFGLYVMYGQSSVSVDSMQKILQHQKGIERIETLNELAWELRKSKDSIGINYALEALKLSKQQKYYKGISDAYSRLGTIALKQENNEDAKDYYIKGLVIDEENNNTYGIGRACNQLGLIYKRERNYLKALEYYQFSLNAFEKNKQYKQASQTAGNIGRLYLLNETYDKSLEYYLKQLDYSKQANDSNRIAKSYRNIGNIQKELKNYKEALTFYKEAEKIYIKKNKTKEIANIMIDIATMYDYLDENVLAKEKYIKASIFIQKNKKGDEGAFHLNFGAFYRKLGQKDSATYHYQKAEEIFKNSNSKKKLLVYYNNFGNLHYDNKKFNEALNNFNLSLALQHTIQDSSMLEKTYLSISNVYKELNNDAKAYIYKDSAYQVGKQEFFKIKIADRQELVHANKNIRSIIAESQKEKAVNKAEKLTMYTIGLLIVLALLSGLFFFITKARKQRQQRVLAEADLEQQKLIITHEKEKQEQQIQELIKTQEMNAINAMISGQEEERKRIAQDLHDNLGSKLSLVKIHYQSVEDNIENIDEEAKMQYEKANQLLDEACKSVREISHNMISGTLSKFGLIPALKELKQTLENVYSKQNQHKIYIELSYHKLDNRLENTMEIQIYRIIQELLNNIIKHAKATQVDIQILKLEKGVNIIVEDDGIGFDVEKQHKGIGLKTIQSRVVNMKGSCLIDSGKGNGTTVTIDIPT